MTDTPALTAESEALLRLLDSFGLAATALEEDPEER